MTHIGSPFNPPKGGRITYGGLFASHKGVGKTIWVIEHIGFMSLIRPICPIFPAT